MKTDRQRLLDQLSRLKPAIKSGGLIPELSHVWFKDQTAFAYDGQLGISIPLDTGLECGLPGGVLLGLLGTSGLPEVSLAPDDSGTSVVVKMGRSSTKMGALDLERGVWPFPKKGKPTETLDLTEDVLRALKHVLVVDPRHVTRVEHKGVLVYRDKKGVALCTTDSSTIATARVSAKVDAGDLIILPRTFAEQVARTCAPGARLSIYDDHLAADADGANVYTQLIEGAEDAQDLREIAAGTAKDHPSPVPVPAGLGIALERAALLEGRDDAVVELAVAGGDLTARGSYRYGDLSERVRLKAEHPDASRQFTASLVRRGLAGASQMSMDDSALILRGAADALYLVAPRRSD